jgi:uncharacterized membrane protein
LTLSYAAVFFAAAASNYLFFFTPRFDLGNMIQVVWSTAHGHFLQMSDPTGLKMSRLGAHFDPFLMLLVPLWWLYPSPLMLLAAQALAVASGAFPVFWLARKHLQSTRFAAVFVVAYLLYAPTQFNTFAPFGVHAVSFAIPLILYAVWFMDEGRMIAFGLCAGVAATTKEEMAAAVGGLGIWYAIRRGHRTAGFAMFVSGLALSLIIFESVIPHFAPGRSDPFAGRYTAVGGTPLGIVRSAFTDPTALMHQAATWHHVGYLALIFGPFLGLWALEPLMLVGALPDLAINLLSSHASQTNVTGHYTAGIAPFIVSASIFGAARLRRKRYVPIALAAVACLLALISPLAYATRSLDSGKGKQVSAMHRAIRVIPPGAPASATRSLGGDVSTRPVLSVFPSVARAQWVLIGPISPLDDEGAFQAGLARLSRGLVWIKVFDEAGIKVFKRRNR